MKTLLRRPLALLLTAATVVALVLAGKFVYAEVRVAPAGDAPDNDDLADADTVLPGDPFFEGEEADYLHVTNVILPQLRERGLAEADIDRIMVDNPARWLAGT